MSRSRSPKCHRGRGCGACGAPECDPISAREAIEEGLTYYPEDPEDPTDVPVRPVDAARDRVVRRTKFSDTPPRGRAALPHQKFQVIDRLDDVWQRFPSLRLGQLIENALHAVDRDGELFTIEDDDLIELLEDLARRFAR